VPDPLTFELVATYAPMVKSNVGRVTVGLPFSYQEDWVGGLYYVRNLVCALGLLPAGLQPRLLVIGDDPKAFQFLKKETGYADLHAISARAIRRVRTRNLLGFPRQPPQQGASIDLVLLGSVLPLADRAIQWVPDFQEERLPSFFSSAERAARRRRNTKWFRRHRHILVSSNEVRRDFERHYGGHGNIVHVVPFASFADRERRSVRAATDPLPARYFLCSNQFWAHKNHAVVLKALALCAGSDAKPFVVFTGRERDYRDRAFAASIRKLAGDLGVEEQVRFLGFLPRGEQLDVAAGAIAVIQPSLCEGWSTIVEDAKALGKWVLASDIAVHREQIARNVDFFQPEDAAALAELIDRYGRTSPGCEDVDYPAEQRKFADNLIAMIAEVVGDLRRRRAPWLTVKNEARFGTSDVI